MVSCRFIPPSDVRGIWPTVRPGIDKCAFHAFGDWISEDVYLACQTGAASLYVWTVNGDYAGAMVLSKKPDFNGARCHIWVLYVEQEYGKHIDDNMCEVEKIAHASGCRKLTFHSPRKGWDRRVKTLGFVPTYTIFEKEV